MKRWLALVLCAAAWFAIAAARHRDASVPPPARNHLPAPRETPAPGRRLKRVIAVQRATRPALSRLEIATSGVDQFQLARGSAPVQRKRLPRAPIGRLPQRPGFSTCPSRKAEEDPAACRDLAHRSEGFDKNVPRRGPHRQRFAGEQARALSTPSPVTVNTVPPSACERANESARLKQTSIARVFDTPSALAPLDAYDREFPHGRYAAQIKGWRASVAFQAHDWQTALDLTLRELTDVTHRDLQPEASLRLANIFAELSTDEFRPALLELIRTRPATVGLLAQYLGKIDGNSGHPLRYLGQYLGDQLGFPAPEPKRENG